MLALASAYVTNLNKGYAKKYYVSQASAYVTEDMLNNTMLALASAYVTEDILKNTMLALASAYVTEDMLKNTMLAKHLPM